MEDMEAQAKRNHERAVHRGYRCLFDAIEQFDKAGEEELATILRQAKIDIDKKRGRQMFRYTLTGY